MDSLTSIRIINLHRLIPNVIPFMQKLSFLGKILSFKGGDEEPTLFNREVGPFEDMWFGISRVYGKGKEGIFTMGENYFGQLGTSRNKNTQETQ